MQNITKPAIAVGLLAALGIGCYTMGQHAPREPLSPMTQSEAMSSPAPAPAAAPLPVMQASTPTQAMMPPTTAQEVTNESSVLQSRQPNQVAPYSTSSATPPERWQTQSAQTTETTKFTKEAPVTSYSDAAVVPATSSTYSEQKTVTTVPAHKAYTQRVAHYKHHKTDKVHVARATKHGAMFALKLPGRLAL